MRTSVTTVTSVTTCTSRLIALCLGVALLSCGDSDSPSLRVDLRTDLLAGREFDGVIVTLGDGEFGESLHHVVDLDRDYVRGVRIGELDIAEGEHFATGVLFKSGVEIVRQRVSVRVSAENTVVTLVIARDCRGVMCPATGGNPIEASCLGGRCVDPRCTLETPEFCPPGECTLASHCDAPACAEASCVVGACLFSADDSLCNSGERCDPSVGCVPEGGELDGGPRDGGNDAAMMPDARPDAPDGGPDMTLDAGSDASFDAGSDASSDAGPDVGPDAGVCAGFQAELGGLINAFRSDAMLAPLACDPGVAQAALLHAQDMCDDNYLGRSAPDGTTYLDHLDTAGVVRGPSALFSARSVLSPMLQFDAWSDEMGEQDVLHDARYGRFGVARVDCPAPTGRWALIFTD